MELRVGDKVRWIEKGTTGVGDRGEVIEVSASRVRVRWEEPETLNYYKHDTRDTYIMREFQPGDRVVYQGRNKPYVGKIGTVVRLGGGFDFIVDLGEKDLYGADYKEASFIYAPAETPTPVTARTPTLPPPPEPKRNPYGRCYFCGQPDSEWLRDRYTCDGCMERYR